MRESAHNNSISSSNSGMIPDWQVFRSDVVTVYFEQDRAEQQTGFLAIAAQDGSWQVL